MIKKESIIAMGFCLIIGLSASTLSAETPEKHQDPIVQIQTTLGDIIVQLNEKKAPISSKNFLDYARSGFYDNTIFHRVIKDFMIQGGGFESLPFKKETGTPIQNEADNGLKNVRGSLAMARTNAPHSATAQFFINTVDNAFLNHRQKSSRGYGYAVFGKVIKGMAVVDMIETVKTNTQFSFQNVPAKPVTIKKISILRDSQNAEPATKNVTQKKT